MKNYFLFVLLVVLSSYHLLQAQTNNYFLDNFENGLSQWSKTGTGWDTTSNNPYSGKYCLTDSKNGNYPVNCNITMSTINQIDLSSAVNPVLQFWDTYQLGWGTNLNISISTDNGTNWTSAYNINSPNGAKQSNWCFQCINLTQYIGKKIKILMRLTSNDPWTGDGYYIDNIEIKEKAEDPPVLQLPFSENFENGIGKWFVSGMGWDTTNAQKFGGKYCLTDSKNGNYPVNCNITMSTINQIDLSSAVNPVLQFWDTYQLGWGTNLNISISTDNGTNWTSAYNINSPNGAKQSNWCFQCINLTQYIGKKIKILMRLTSNDPWTGDGYYIDNIEIKEKIAITTPTGTGWFMGGSTHDINWNWPGPGNVKISFSSDNAQNWQTIVDSIPAINGTYLWRLPYIYSVKCRIKIESTLFPVVYSVSDTSFQIVTDSSQIGMIAYYKFNGNALDHSDYGNNGTVVNVVPDYDRFNIPQNAYSFSGSNSIVYTNYQYSNPFPITYSLWFNTTTTTGGKIIGFGDSQINPSTQSYDRHIYMTNNGRLIWGVYTGSVMTIQTDSSYNDGRWHHVVASVSPNGMSLYVDNKLINTLNVTSAHNFQGYFKIGGDNIATSWPNAPSAIFFKGQIDDIRIYNRALMSGELLNLYTENLDNKAGIFSIYPNIATTNKKTADINISAYPIPPNAMIELINGTDIIKADSVWESNIFNLKARFSWKNSKGGTYDILMITPDGGNTLKMEKGFTLVYSTEPEEPLDVENDGFRNISSFANLAWIFENDSSHTFKYKLDNDIDASESEYWYNGKGFNPIANFSGIIDGQGHSIKYLTFNRGIQDSVAFISNLSSRAVIRGLSLTNCTIKGQNYVAGLVASNNGTISNCTITGTVSGYNNVGGVTGINNGTIKFSYNGALIMGNDYVGGLAGTSSGGSIIIKSNNQGRIIGKDLIIGGIIGSNRGTISDCYNLASVVGSGEVGGIAGWNYGAISNVYNIGLINGAGNAVGAVLGLNTGSSLVSSYSNKETSGGIASQYGVNGTPKTTAEMKTVSTYTNWDFVNTWEIMPTMNDGYPQLTWSTNPKKIKCYSPDKIANTDSCSITFEGSGFDSNTKVFLSKTAQDTIKADTLIFSENNCIARINLKKAVIGSWNLTVQFLDTTISIQNGLMVEQKKEGSLKIEILGANKFRTGRTTSVTVRVTNTGNVTIDNPLIHVAVDSEDSNFVIITNSITDVERKFCKLLNVDMDSIAFETTANAIGHNNRKYKFGVFNCETLLPYGISELVLNITSSKDFSIAAWNVDYSYNDLISSIINNMDSKNKSNKNSSCYEDYSSCMSGWMNQYGRSYFTQQDLKNKINDILIGGLGGYNVITGLNNVAIDYSKTRNFKSTAAWFVAGTIFGIITSKSPAGAVVSGGIFAVVQMMMKDAQLIADYTNVAKYDCASKYYNCTLPYNYLIQNFSSVSSFDPNDKIGYRSPSGSTYFSDNTTNFTYIINFENKETATASAQEVSITDTLDMKYFDISTFKAGLIKIGNKTYSAPLNVQENKWTIDMRPERNLITYVTLNLAKESGVAKWYFRCVDPVTMDFPANATDGFLPPNDSLGRGEGSVMFTINLKDSTMNNASIKNRAQIVFDNNAPIYTPTWTNTRDIIAPTSYMNQPKIVCDSIAILTWGGKDNANGSGLYSYNVYVKKSNEAFSTLLANTQRDSIDFTFQKGFGYSFYVTATDSAGNTEVKSNIPDIILGVTGSAGLPKDFNLSQNYPNPFNPVTTINYQLPVTSMVTLKFYNILGQEVVTLVNEEKKAGFYKIKFNGSNLASGVYIYRIWAGNYVNIKKMMLVK